MSRERQIPYPLIFGDPISIRIRDIGREAALRSVVYCPVGECDASGTDRISDRHCLEIESFSVAIVRWYCLSCEGQFQTDYDGRHIKYGEEGYCL